MPELEGLFEKLLNTADDSVHEISDQLAEIGSKEVRAKMLELLYHENDDVQYLAARTLSNVKDNQEDLIPFFEAIHSSELKNRNGHLVEALNGFDISGSFVDVFKLYLFGGLKASAMAKLLLDYTEFDLTPRMLKKAKKHWNHFEHNTAHDDRYEAKKEEVLEIFSDLEELFGDEQSS